MKSARTIFWLERFKEEVSAETLFVYPIEGLADRVEKVSRIDRSRPAADNFDRTGGDSFAKHLEEARKAQQPKKKDPEEMFEEKPFFAGGMSYYNRHAMTAYFSMADSKTNFTC